MSIRLERVEAAHDVRVLDSAETFEITKDADEPEPDGTLSIITDSGEDGIQIAGTETALHGWLNRARNNLTTRTAGPRILCVLDLSTHHLPQHICDDLDDYSGVTAHDTEYGWLLYVPGMLTEHRVDHPDTVPEEVWQLWEYASRFDASYILLHSDADRVDALPSWDW
ncbi:DUF5983 family protein [Actinoplanes flavus]|uniref:DUF5983 domain-containing protein n=1 Tax=Actinoplanes flavus TaxID=2820290 RepID=A0ABS3UD69_9ACTN|nr:hypothetical protein [Actinoplanes flavus]MBO3736673.1 hypothetical protein [Actinoplanes flavus]